MMFLFVLFLLIQIANCDLTSGHVIALNGASNISIWDIEANVIISKPFAFSPPNNYTYMFAQDMTVDHTKNLIHLLIVTEIQKNASLNPCQTFAIHSYHFMDQEISFLSSITMNLSYCYPRTAATYPFIFWNDVTLQMWVMYYPVNQDQNVVSTIDLQTGELSQPYNNDIFNGYWGEFASILVHPYIYTVNCYYTLTAFNLNSLSQESSSLQMGSGVSLAYAFWKYDSVNQIPWAAVGDIGELSLFRITPSSSFSNAQVTQAKIEEFWPWFITNGTSYRWSSGSFIGEDPITGKQVDQTKPVALPISYWTQIMYTPN